MRLLLLCLTLTVCAFAQQASTTSLIGRVMDSGGAVIPNATVKAVEEGTQETLTRTTNGAGLYYFEMVRIGTYTITAQVLANASGQIESAANVTPPPGYDDPNTNDNAASDTDTIIDDRLFADGFDPP